jgi:guanylate kinase
MLYLILGPSGVGKGTQIKLLREGHPEFIFPRSVTTRKMRPQESEGNPYHFISDEEFDEHIKNHNLLEYAVVHQAARYGTLKPEIESALADGKTVIKELDIQGLMKIKKTIENGHADFLKDNLTSIFIMPPDEETLIERITGRSVIKEDELQNRLESARNEISMSQECTKILNTKRGESPESVYKKLEKLVTNHTD